MSMIIDHRDRTIVVVGGTSGINRGIAEAFAQQGARVAVASRRQEKVDDTVAALKELGAKDAMGVAFDVRDAEATAEGLAQMRQAFGDFDALISGAAGNFPARMNDMSANAFRSVVEIDLLGTAHVMKAAYPHLKKPGASVINISAPQAYLAYETQVHVCAAKAGVDQVTRGLSLEWGPDGIRVNSVVPGYIDGTEGMKRLGGAPEDKDMLMSSLPLGRMGKPEDIARMCLFLSSDYASYVSGAIIPIDGATYQNGPGVLSKILKNTLDQAG